MVSYQCSAHSTGPGIQGVFKLAAKLQPRSNESEEDFVSVVVLDEVGLAEDSGNMPLKVFCKNNKMTSDIRVGGGSVD